LSPNENKQHAMCNCTLTLCGNADNGLAFA